MTNINRSPIRSALSTLVVLAVFAAVLLPLAAVPATVSASNATVQDWPLQLIGATNITLTQSQFETMANATPSNSYADTPGTGTGLALWRLI
ncbi:MAG: hypothetical protein NTU41_02400, partial [Chloroflexi bacterium]|nr:hypothetical protein [Chloroflexota bacterium]